MTTRWILAIAALATPLAGQQTPEAERGWLGVIIEEAWTVEDGECRFGVTVEQVYPGAPADRAGLTIGDLVLRIDGRDPAEGIEQLLRGELRPGERVRFAVLRDGKVRELVAVAGDRPATLTRRTGQRPSLPAPTGVAGPTTPAPPRGVVRVGPDSVVVCGEPVHGRFAVISPAVEFQVVQARADSLRQILAERAARARIHVDTLHEQIVMVGPAGTYRVQTRTREKTDPATWIREGVPVVPDSVHAITIPLPEAPRVGEVVVRGEEPSAGLVWSSTLQRGSRAVAGAELTELNPELARYFRGAESGLLVLQVVAGTPAARAGLRAGDVVVAGDGRAIESIEDLRALLSRPTRQPLVLNVVREGRHRTLNLAWD